MNSKEAFLREVSFLKTLRSEYVVDLIDYYEDPNGKAHCVVLEYGDKSLADFLKRGPLQRNERKFNVDRLLLSCSICTHRMWCTAIQAAQLSKAYWPRGRQKSKHARSARPAALTTTNSHHHHHSLHHQVCVERREGQGEDLHWARVDCGRADDAVTIENTESSRALVIVTSTGASHQRADNQGDACRPTPEADAILDHPTITISSGVNTRTKRHQRTLLTHPGRHMLKKLLRQEPSGQGNRAGPFSLFPSPAAA